MHRTRVRVVEDALDANNTIARANRADFDRAGAIIAFQRAPGNRTPDVDPSSAVVLVVDGGPSRWSAPTVCR